MYDRVLYDCEQPIDQLEKWLELDWTSFNRWHKQEKERSLREAGFEYIRPHLLDDILTEDEESHAT